MFKKKAVALHRVLIINGWKGNQRNTMDLMRGLLYNVRGLLFGIKSGRLLFLGILRLLIVAFIMLVLTGLILSYHEELMGLMWSKPEGSWIVWLWHLLSWLVTLFLIFVGAIFAYLISQILFSAFIMDYMSRITEKLITGSVHEPLKIPFWKLFIYLIKQELPRTIFPVILSLIIMIVGWVIALGPLLAVLSSIFAVIFLAWDNTDLVPARRMAPFRTRLGYMSKTILFHIGFGLPFLVPVLNIIFLSFAPVGATLFFIDRYHPEQKQS